MYLPVASIANADALSRALWQIMIPAGYVGDTVRFCGWLVHPTSGAVMIDLPDNITAPVMNPSATPLAGFLAPFVTAGNVTPAELTALRAKVTAAAALPAPGNVIAVADIIPAFFLNQAQTRAQLVAAGWFPTLPTS